MRWTRRRHANGSTGGRAAATAGWVLATVIVEVSVVMRRSVQKALVVFAECGRWRWWRHELAVVANSSGSRFVSLSPLGSQHTSGLAARCLSLATLKAGVGGWGLVLLLLCS